MKHFCKKALKRFAYYRNISYLYIINKKEKI